jgi:D-alanyl-D-alanine carboxypeptidase
VLGLSASLLATPLAAGALELAEIEQARAGQPVTVPESGERRDRRAPAASSAREWRAYRARVQQAIDAVVAGGAPGVVAYARDGRREFTVTSGLRDVAAQKRMQKKSEFRVASITKTFVAAALLRLVGRGILGLDDSVEAWLPGVVPNGAAITIRQLLEHTSGVYNYTTDNFFLSDRNADPTRAWTPDELLAVAFSHPPRFEPGSAYEYSNTGYVLAALVLEAATGLAAATVLEEEIFEPLRLRRVGFEEDLALPGPFARGYRLFSGGRVEEAPYHPTGYWGAGNVAADARTIARFFRALLGGDVIEAQQLEQMRTLGAYSGGKILVGYGLGLYQAVLGECDEPWWGHDGYYGPGYVSISANSEDASRQVVMLINASQEFFSPGPTYDAFDTAWCGLFE